MKKKLILRAVKRNDTVGTPPHYVEMLKDLGITEKVLILDIDDISTSIMVNYGIQKTENLVAIDKPVMVEDIPIYIERYNPSYLLVNNIQLLRTRDGNLNKFDTLNTYIATYDVNILLIDYLNIDENISKYDTTIYRLCAEITFIDTDNTITKIR